ncbi:hypothetical protein HETIRDRAFT_481085 [Heterobasidion irregulare TC 32-1]|uniref:Uncharacterized protein n=1 Tax=Heterobasidion irregulare (strain TC 32-1) TaxID=747525 RepID=W4JU29_HETIT|nr:uncharacterized protein HETIRDRAFT_481085 [Heterobasidion irregulare TC 32-1]ETW76964.1 hypothetical protein HETIRDRAFT_481085 [Heterobasidion irregulare TC 32-1]
MRISADINDVYTRQNSRLFNSKQFSLQRFPCLRSVLMVLPPGSNLCSSPRASSTPDRLPRKAPSPC